MEAQLRGVADQRARVKAELLRITCEETFLRRQQRRLLHGIFAAKNGEDLDEVKCSPEVEVASGADRSSCFEIPFLSFLVGLTNLTVFFLHLISLRVLTRRAAAREGAGARNARPGSACSSCPGLPQVTNVARVWWWYHVHVEYRIPLSLGTPRSASMRAASAASAKASGASEAPFCKACRNMEKLGKQNGEAHPRVRRAAHSMITMFCSIWDNSAVFGPPSCAIMVLLGMRWSRVAFISPHALPILSCSFGTSSEVSSREGGVLQIVVSWHLNFGTRAEPFSPGSRGDTS